ncbi:asparagine synthase (glutamine-hydrolyzing) [Duganella sp. FT94W]|uniref:asparagine synthase (glutamine-hydrolyzing) n=1 Tax=Duganella lactea TaxID=2692173 RepID=A0ABW9VBG8_9BURK|nr:asparagine synthase (glutamine-hydrolyzing) [Duganella lactea]MYM36165.1 asparagine synthase (glutamine-hydrolyzing) [Duganella lactea]
MCGLTGFWPAKSRLADEAALQIGERMAMAIRHRGPDDMGTWLSPEGLCLSHRRLSIIDLSAAGHQPMHSHDGRYTVAYNGEIYNYQALRDELEAERSIDWRGHSDTEVLLQAVVHWGVAATLSKLNGMFAIALWDADERALYLARDRFGEKPLYYGYARDSLVFGSELKSLYAHPDWRGEIDTDAVRDFLRLCYVPAPRSIFRNIRKLMPGCFLKLTAGDIATQSWPTPSTYWSAREVALAGIANPAQGSEADLIDETERQMRNAVGLRMVADVPLGAFLSGGIDSSLVVAMMQSQSSRPIKTFSIGFNDSRYDEAQNAAAIARHMGTEHNDLYVSDQEALDVIPLLPAMYDEPFADSSQIPTYLVSKMARDHVTVTLSGDGGDELFGGYNRHTWAPRVWNVTHRFPDTLRNKAATMLLSHTPARLDAMFAKAQRFLPKRSHIRMPGDKLHKLAGVMGAADPQTLYADLASATRRPDAYLVQPATGTANSTMFPFQQGMSMAQWMMLCDTENYMPNDILTKVDRASMAVSLEARVPFLDADLYAWAWRLPMSMKIRKGEGKWILKQVLYRHVPQALLDRPKAGFGIPMDQLLRGPLRAWVEEKLAVPMLKKHGVLQPEEVHTLLAEHMAGQANNAYLLWNMLVLTTWIETFEDAINV